MNTYIYKHTCIQSLYMDRPLSALVVSDILTLTLSLIFPYLITNIKLTLSK